MTGVRRPGRGGRARAGVSTGSTDERGPTDRTDARLDGRTEPDATHLELLRRLNVAAGAGVGGLAELVLTTGAPGRGPVDVPLPWPGEQPRFGSRPVEPEQLSSEELVRLASGVLARLLPGVRPVAETETLPDRWPLPWRTRFRLHGSPATAHAVRRSLVLQGLVESDWRPTHVVVARPLEVMMAEHWVTRAGAGGILKWSTLWRRSVAADRLPGTLDVAATAQSLLARGDGPVHVVVARDADHAAALVAGLLGVGAAPVPPAAEHATADLLRRVNRLTALECGPDRVPDLAARLAGVLRDVVPADEAVPAPLVPRPSLDWAREAAARQADRLRTADYAVHGDPAELAPTDHRGTGRVDRDRTLELALRACLATWQLQEGLS